MVSLKRSASPDRKKREKGLLVDVLRASCATNTDLDPAFTVAHEGAIEGPHACDFEVPDIAGKDVTENL